MSVDSLYEKGSEHARPSITETIIDRIAREDGRDPLELPPLWNVIDPEALETLFASTKSGHARAGSVGFRYCGYWVTVEDDGDDTVTVSLEAEDSLTYDE